MPEKFSTDFSPKCNKYDFRKKNSVQVSNNNRKYFARTAKNFVKLNSKRFSKVKKDKMRFISKNEDDEVSLSDIEA